MFPKIWIVVFACAVRVKFRVTPVTIPAVILDSQRTNFIASLVWCPSESDIFRFTICKNVDPGGDDTGMIFA